MVAAEPGDAWGAAPAHQSRSPETKNSLKPLHAAERRHDSLSSETTKQCGGFARPERVILSKTKSWVQLARLLPPLCAPNSAFLPMRKFAQLLQVRARAGGGSQPFSRAAPSSHFAGRASLLQRLRNSAAEERSAKKDTVSLWRTFLEAGGLEGSCIPQTCGEDRWG